MSITMHRTLNKSEKIFVRRRQSSTPKARLFCFPFAGGNASTYGTWHSYLNDNIEVISIQLPGRASRLSEKPHDNIDTLVDEILGEKSFFFETPFFLFGHSLGGLIAYEITRRLQEIGDTLPTSIFVSGTRAPHISRRKEKIHLLSNERFLSKLKTYNGTPEEVLHNRELMHFLLPTLKADFKIAEEYKPNNAKVDIPIIVFGGDKDPSVSFEHLDGWSKHTNSRFKRIVFQGDHFFIDNQAPNIISTIIEEMNIESL